MYAGRRHWDKQWRGGNKLNNVFKGWIEMNLKAVNFSIKKQVVGLQTGGRLTMHVLVVRHYMEQDCGMKDTTDIVKIYRIGSNDNVDVCHIFIIT